MQSDTPRTDAENWIRDMGFEKWVSIDFARELERELAAAKKQRDEATSWRPIETAPMDGTVVMLYGDGRVTCGSWIAEQDITVSDHVGCYPSGETTPAYWQSHDGGFTEEHPPTHWMPLPQPPREKDGGGA